MELIRTLNVVGFPGVKDGTYEFSQDTIIKGNWGDGKTSMLKAITWLLTGKDLQGRIIPNITEKTVVVSRGSIELQRNHKGLSGNLNRILKGGVDHILARIIPGYIFSSGLTNKKIVEIITGIDVDNYNSGPKGITLSSLSDAIKESKSNSDILNTVSTKVMDFNKSIKREISLSVLHLMYDYEQLFNFSSKTDLINKNIRMIRTKISEYRSNVYEENDKNNNDCNDPDNHKYTEVKDIEDLINKLKEYHPIMNDILARKKYPNVGNLNRLLSSLLNITNMADRYVDSVVNTLRQKKNISGQDLSIDKSLYEYMTLLADCNNVGELIKEKQELLNYIYRSVNERLARYGMNFSGNNVLTINVEHQGKKLSLLELPKHIRFLMEINLCSRLQLDYIEDNNGRNSNQAGLILVDDSPLDDDDETIDSILTEGLSHQVILTKLDKKSKGLEFII